MELPTEKSKVLEDNAGFMIIYSRPKAGKTTLLQGFEDLLHMDFEEGGKYVSTMRVELNSMNDIIQLVKALKKSKTDNPSKEFVYTYGAIDTATALEDVVQTRALQLYRATPMGKNFGLDTKTNTYKNVNILTIPQGGGYMYVREAYKEVLGWLKPYFKYLILLGHTKEKNINDNGTEMFENALDLTGKLERIISAQADALGFMYREDNKTIISFNGGSDSIVEARPNHLRGKKITVMESDDEGNLTYYIDKLYI